MERNAWKKGSAAMEHVYPSAKRRDTNRACATLRRMRASDVADITLMTRVSLLSPTMYYPTGRPAFTDFVTLAFARKLFKISLNDFGTLLKN